MGAKAMLNYLAFDNPISKTVLSVSLLTLSVNVIILLLQPIYGRAASNVPLPDAQGASDYRQLWKLAAEAGPFVKLAGISGAAAVILGAYGAHKTYPKDNAAELKAVYESANRFHFFHTLALLGVPLCRYPMVTGTLIIVGTTLFSGACYYRAFTGEHTYGKLAPMGGTILIFAWLSFVF